MFEKPIGRTLNHILVINKEKLLVHYNYQKKYNKAGDKMEGHELIPESINLIEASELNFQPLFIEKVCEKIWQLDNSDHALELDLFEHLAEILKPQ